MRDVFLLAYRNIKERKARSALTVLGIAVGIAAIISLMGIGYGMEQVITGELTKMADTIMVMPGKMLPGRGYMEMGSFTEKDVKDVRRISGIKDISAMTMGIAEVEYRREKIPVEIIGGDPRDMESIYKQSVELKKGRWLRENDYKGCVIGHSVANDYFDEDIHVNDKIRVNGNKYIVVGIFEKGSTTTSSDVDPHVFFTMRASKDVLKTDDIKFIMIRIYDVDEAEEIAEKIEEEINDNHGLDDFTEAMTMGSIIEQIGMIFKILQGVLVGIASISLIVASIGIMNTMLMSVMERTHEIGVMKAIGAKNRDVLSLFLLESSMVSVVGGVLGGALGVIGANVISFGIGTAFGVEFPAIVKVEVLLGGIAVAMLVGVLSGLYPARKASKMSPVEAVRYE
jgi:putative ABC transport system permease protein